MLVKNYWASRDLVPATLGARVFVVRCNKTMTQGTLARLVGISQNALCAIESDRADPRVSHLVQIARALGTSPNVLLGWEDAPELDTSRRRDAPTPAPDAED